MSDNDRDAFFVGYLPTPAGVRPFLRTSVLVVLIGVVAVAASLAALQRDPGDGVWDLSESRELTGEVELLPCPLIAVRGPRGELVSVLLVGEGKVGASERLAPFDGTRVTVRGHTLTRAGVRMFEIEDGPGGVVPATAAPPGRPFHPAPSGPRSPVTLLGEVIDPKCYAGAMKPGDGKPHKGCAALCLRGGIPPFFVAADGVAYLLVDDRGASPAGAKLDAVLPFVGDRIEARGDVEVRGDLKLFHLSEGALRRLR